VLRVDQAAARAEGDHPGVDFYPLLAAGRIVSGIDDRLQRVEVSR